MRLLTPSPQRSDHPSKRARRVTSAAGQAFDGQRPVILSRGVPRSHIGNQWRLCKTRMCRGKSGPVGEPVAERSSFDRRDGCYAAAGIWRCVLTRPCRGYRAAHITRVCRGGLRGRLHRPSEGWDAGRVSNRGACMRRQGRSTVALTPTGPSPIFLGMRRRLAAGVGCAGDATLAAQRSGRAPGS